MEILESDKWKYWKVTKKAKFFTSLLYYDCTRKPTGCFYSIKFVFRFGNQAYASLPLLIIGKIILPGQSLPPDLNF